MSFMAKNPLSVPEVEHTPSTPPGTRGLFAKKDGWYIVDDEGEVTKIATLDDIKDIDLEGNSIVFGNPNNKALTKNSVVLGGGDDDKEDYNIAGQMGYLICGVYTDDNSGIYKFIIEDENCVRPPVGANIKYAIPFGETTSWTENGIGKITDVEDYSESDYSKFVSIQSETGYFVITLESKPDLTKEHLDKDYGYDVRTARIACKMWSYDYPEYGNYQIAYSATAIGKRTQALGDSSFAFGKGSKATGAYALAGSGEASGTSSVTLAGATKAAGERAVAIGAYSEANEDYTITLGLNDKANKPYTTLIGSNLESTNSETDNSFIVLGTYNDPDTSEFFTIGTGGSSNSKRNGLTLDREGNLTVAGDMSCENLHINSSKIGKEGEIGWFKFASYEFVEGGYPRSEALLYISNCSVGSKFISLVEITIDQIPNGYHSVQGIVFTQIAGIDITKNLAYYVDPDTNNITFYIKKEKFQIINVSNLRSRCSFSRNLINVDINNVCLNTINITGTASIPYATISGLENGSLIPERAKNAGFADGAGSAYYAAEADKANSATNADYATKAGEAAYATLAQEANFTLYAMHASENDDGYTLIPQTTNKNVDGTLNYTFEHNTVIRANGTPTAIEFVFNDNVYPEYYSSELCFDSGETPTMLVYPEAPILNWVGTDCTVSDDNYSIFSPQANTHYDVLFYYNGTVIVGLVNGYKYASGNA